MDQKKFDQLIKELSMRNFQFLKFISRGAAITGNTAATASIGILKLLMIFGKGVAETFIARMIREKVVVYKSKSEDLANITRDNSLVSTLLVAYQKQLGAAFLHDLVECIVAQVPNLDQCEVDPDIIHRKQPNLTEAEITMIVASNKSNLENAFIQMFEILTNHLENIPAPITRICTYLSNYLGNDLVKSNSNNSFHGIVQSNSIGHMLNDDATSPRKSTVDNIEDDPISPGSKMNSKSVSGPGEAFSTSEKVIGSFLFLRFIVPAITSPALVSVTANVTPDMRRGLVLCSKMLTLIVNDTEFGVKEKHMTAFNGLLQPFRRTIAQFIRYCASAHKAELFPDEVPLTALPFRDIDTNAVEPAAVDLSNWKVPLLPKKISNSSDLTDSIEGNGTRKISATSKGSNEMSHSVENSNMKPSVTSFETKKLSAGELPEIIERESSKEVQNPFAPSPNVEIELQAPKRRQAIRKQSDTAKASLQGLMYEIKTRALLAESPDLDVLTKVVDTKFVRKEVAEPISEVQPPPPPEPKPVEQKSPEPSPPQTLLKKLTKKHQKDQSGIKEESSISARDSEFKSARSTTLAKIRGLMLVSKGSMSDRNPIKGKPKAPGETEMDADILAFFDILCRSFATLKKDIEIQTAQMQDPEKTECEKRGKRFLTLLMSGYKEKPNPF